MASKNASLIAPAKTEVPQPAASSLSVDELKAAAQELHKKNMAFLAKFLPGISKSLANFKPKGEMVWTDKGDLNVRTGNVFMYKQAAKADTQAQVNAFARQPTRVVFAKPEFMFEEVEGASRPVEGDYAFVTQKYDDRNTDDHSERYVRAMGDLIKEKQAKLANVITRKDESYFLTIYGLGLGYHIMPLVEKFNPAVVILMESDLEAFYHSTFTFDWEAFYAYMNDSKKKIRIIFENDATVMLTKLNGAVQGECLLGLDGILSFMHHQSPVLNVVFAEFNSAKTANLASFIGFTVDEYNMMKNSFRNLRPGTKRVLNIVRQKADVPVIIVGSGPSLEDNIEWLKSMQDRAVIISSGSSMAVLLKNGIKPDFQAVLERAKAVYDRHKEAAEQWDLKDTHVILTTTIWPGIDAFFKDVVYFFRPALSPLGVFCRDSAEILNHEGPQVTNTAFAFARRLGFSEYYMLGIDLGAADPSRPRAEKAWISPGIKQRELTIPVRGNHGRTVFTDRSLTQQRQTIENQIRSLPGGPVYNLSSGVRIAGAEAKFTHEVELKPLQIEKKQFVQQLVDQFPVFTRERFIGAWEASGVRDNVAEYITAMIKALNGATRWDNQLIKKIEDINAYIGKAVRKQYAPRLFRGSVLRICMFINSVFLRLDNRDIENDLFVATRELLIQHLRNLEREAYALADELEAEDEYFGVKLS
jgi:hypothetical protein